MGTVFIKNAIYFNKRNKKKHILFIVVEKKPAIKRLSAK